MAKIAWGGWLLSLKNIVLYLHAYEGAHELSLGGSEQELLDYKFMCFNGEVKCSFVCSDRFSEDGLKVTFFDRNWNLLPFDRHYPRSEKPIPKPYNYEKMVELAEKLSKDIPFVRIDFYESGKRIQFGELTFYPGSGFEEFTPESWDGTLGNWIEIPVGGGYTVIDDITIFFKEAKPSDNKDADTGLTDYKIYCFNGKAKLLMVASNRFSEKQTRFDYFDRQGKWLDLVWGNPRSDTEPKLNVNVEELFQIAEKLSKGIPHLRVDLYYADGRIHFGETTFYDASGFEKFDSDSWDKMLGNWIEIPVGGGLHSN